MNQTAKLFLNGRSQAVRLPAAFRFDGTEVYIRRDKATGDVILSSKAESWDSFFECLKDLDVPANFLSPEERAQGAHPEDPFADWVES